MNTFRISLRAGDVMIGEDEIGPLIEQLEALRREADELASDVSRVYVDYEMVREILRQRYPQAGKLKVRLGNLWSAVTYATLHEEVPFDAVCTACQVALHEHVKRSPNCHKVATSSVVVAVGAASLRGYANRFLAYAARKAGPAVCSDYQYLVNHLPKE